MGYRLARRRILTRAEQLPRPRPTAPRFSPGSARSRPGTRGRAFHHRPGQAAHRQPTLSPMDDATLSLLVRIVAHHLNVADDLTASRTAVERPAGSLRALGRSAPSPGPPPEQLLPASPPGPRTAAEHAVAPPPVAPVLPALRPSRDPTAGCDNAGCLVGPRGLWSIRVRSSSMKRASLTDVADLCPAHLGPHLTVLLEAGDVSPSVGPIEVERSLRWLGPPTAPTQRPAPRPRQRRPKATDPEVRPSDRGDGAPAPSSPGSPSPSGPDQPPPMKQR